jgi:hypothetical protein
MKKIKLLVISSILSTSVLFSANVFAKASAIDINASNGNIYEYDYPTLKTSALVYVLYGSSDSGAKLYNDFVTRKSSIKAFYDDTRKSYVDFSTTTAAADSSTTSGQNFDLDNFLDNSSTPTIALNPIKITTDSNNNVVVGTQSTTPSVDLSTLKLNTTTVPYTTIAIFKLNVSDPQDYTVTVKGKTAQFNSTTGYFGLGFNGTLATSDFTAVDFVISSKSTTTTVDESALNAEIVTASALIQANYTTASWADMQAALTTAKADVANTSITQDAINADLTNLTNTIDALIHITTEKIAKIEITSTILGVSSPTTSNGVTVGGNGYATYKVLDQYGDDITSSALAQGITWTCALGTVTANNGLLTITPFNGSFLTNYTTITINGFDAATGVTATTNLTTPKSQATLSNITLNKLYCTNNANAVLTAGDTTDSFYIDYTATDSNGNTTNNYNLIKAGLTLSDGISTGLISSNSNDVNVALVTDPSNSNNALIKVTPTANSSSIVVDEPIVITAFTNSGKSASINLTLKKALTLDNFTLIAPSQTVYAGDKNVIIPFKAVDQNGNTLTKYSDINGEVVLNSSFPSGALQLIENSDGTASLELNVPSDAVQAPLTSKSYTIQAVATSSGKFSSLNLMVHQLNQ